MKKFSIYIAFMLFLTTISCGGGSSDSSGVDSGGPDGSGDVTLSSHVDDWRDEVIYFMLTDRFNDGDTSNNSQMSGGADYFSGDGKTYQGGDFKGITAKMNYLSELGITAIWITSPIKQAWEDSGYTSYHGYWAQDFLSVDPHLGTFDDFKNMISAAHAKNIKVIMDVVVNHMGSLFYYPGESDQWNPTYNSSGTYDISWLEDVSDFTWAENANRVKPMPVEFQNPDWFSRKGGNATTGSGDEVYYGDFAGLRDINTTRTDVREKFKEIFKMWIEDTDVDGFRIDTVKHIEQDFWEDFCSEIRTWAASDEGGNKKFYMVAEVYDGSASNIGNYTNNNKLDSALGFFMAEAIFGWNSNPDVSVFRGTWSSRPKTNVIESRLSDIASEANLNASSLHTNGDGLTAREKMGYFIDNHDIYRFLHDESDSDNADASATDISNLQLALGWLLTWEGIPVIYYGTEQNYKQSLSMASGGEMGAGSGNCEKGNRPRLWEIKNSSNGNTAFDTTNETFKLIKGLTQLRSTYEELRRGAVSIKWTDSSGDGSGDDDGILAYVKSGYTTSLDDDILVVINTNDSYSRAAYYSSTNYLGTDWPVGTTLEVVDIPGYQSGATVNDGSNDVTEVTTVTQSGKTSAVYFKVPANSIRILKVK